MLQLLQRNSHAGCCKRPTPFSALLFAFTLSCALVAITMVQAKDAYMTIVDFVGTDYVSQLGTRWSGVSDQVIGGISQATILK